MCLGPPGRSLQDPVSDPALGPPQEKCHQYWPAERSARYQYFVVDPMAEYNMPQYILREFKVTDARVSGAQQRLGQYSGGVFTRVGAAWHCWELLWILVITVSSRGCAVIGCVGSQHSQKVASWTLDNEGSRGNDHIVSVEDTVRCRRDL